MPAPGTRVAWWDSHTLRLAIVLADEGRRVRLLDRQGRERRVPPNRVALEIDRRGDPAGGTARVEAREELGALEARVEASAADVDVDTLWELARESGAAPPLEVLARLALDRDDGEGRASVILALERDGVHFVRRGPQWEPRPAEVVEGIRRQRAREAERVAEREALIASLVAASRGRPFDLDWGLGAPAPGLPEDGFSARFERDLEAPAGRLRFDLQARGALRLWLDDRLLADVPASAEARSWSETLDLSEARTLHLVLEYADAGGASSLSLAWESTEAPQEIYLPVALR